ncbi:MAG TPA: LpqB family beta-propeller domain-containing protein [Actinophytocola sp.]|uniref:LpqB family beta-propeller domain-containing protein n=1 Tax=Actinophytocola sp. TaxID=1872138 RepID=UPI002E09F279|nr:LpqB family beta-propeller domain-containing protein [Actinophytocola sp.]
MRTWLAAVAAVLTVLFMSLSACANIPEQSTPQAENNDAGPTPNPVPGPDAKADPFALVRGFVELGGNPEAAKAYLSEAGRSAWPGDNPPTIINDNFGTVPLPVSERKIQGDEQQTLDVTVVLTVTKVGQLGADRAYTPAFGTAEYRVVVHRPAVGEPWRIQVPPDTVLVTSPDFNRSYKRVSLYFFDPDFRVLVPDLRYVAAEPATGIPPRVIGLLLDGPSDTLRGAVKTEIGPDAEMRTNAVYTDGALVVNLTKIGDRTPADRTLMAAQIVLSLREVTQGRIRLLVDQHPLVDGHGDWRPSDLPSYDAATRPGPDLPGLYTVNGRVFSLRDGAPVPGQAGNGELRIQSAAQSVDGKTLAVVQDVPSGARLRIGAFGGALPEVDLAAPTLTRPTWMPGTANSASNELWVVQNNFDVIRMVRTGNGTWVPSAVSALDLKPFGTITDLRLSRDGVRLAAVANGQVVVASVVRDKESVSIHSPRVLQGNEIRGVIGVDWGSQDTIVAATGARTQPVVNIPVDGYSIEPFSSANLGSSPVTAIAAAPDREVVAADRTGMWTVSDVGQVWRLQAQHQIPNARPFYPG